MRKRIISVCLAACTVLLGVIPTSAGAAEHPTDKQPPIPAPKGPIFRVPASGSVTYDLNTGAIVSEAVRTQNPSKGWLYSTAVLDEMKDAWNPSETVTVTRKEFSAQPTMGAARSIRQPTNRVSLSASGCATYTWQIGTSLLWGKMSQTYCWNNGWLSYWPAANCWGYSSAYAPSYAYLSCHTSQVYGYGWNQGRTTWDLDLCPAWVPIWGACTVHSYYHNTYYFSNTGSAWKI